MIKFGTLTISDRIKYCVMGIVMSKNEILRRLNTLRIKPSGLKQRKYGVSVKYFSGDERVPSKRIDYEATTDLNLEYNKGILTLTKENIFYDQHEPDGIDEILSSSIAKALYPIQTHINEKGLCTQEILNLEEIKTRWAQQKLKISEKYSSEVLHDFFLAADNRFENRTGLEESLRNDWLWSLFFHPRFIDYGELRKAESALFLPVIPYQPPVRFPGIQIIHRFPTDYHSFTIEFESREIPADPYFISRNRFEKSSCFMSVKVFFDTDVYHHFPMHIRAFFEVYLKDRSGKKDIIKKINYTQYQLETEKYNAMVLDADSPFITRGLVVSEPNQWGFYKNKYENDW